MSIPTKSRQLVSRDDIVRFVQYLSEISYHIKSAPRSESLEFSKTNEVAKIVSPDYIAFFRMSDALYRNRGLAMRELSQEMCVPLSTATRIVGLSVDHGVVQRSSDPKDRRIVRVSLTGMGKKLHKTFERQVSHSIKMILNCLSTEEQMTLLSLLERIVGNLKAEGR